MSLQNPNTVITEQRLNEFYQGILPYLGGMPEMVANKFSKGDLYSTDEKMIGQWVDGKPLYQKTIVDTLPSEPASASYASKSIDVGASIDYGQVVDLIIQDSAAYLSTFYATNDMSKFVKGFVCSNAHSSTPNKVLLNCNSWYAKNCYVTIQYTKTTDSAISIGSDTDYSTEEKIIGTWIDGKYIYQKTFVLTNNLYISSRSWENVIAIDTPIDAIITNTIIRIAGGTVATTNYSVEAYYRYNEGYLQYYCAVNSLTLEAGSTITIQYTKTN